MKKNRWRDILINLDFILAAAVLAMLIVLTFLGVIWRYALNAPFTWLEEVQMACIVWIVFGAAGGAFRTGNHVAIEMIVDMMPEKMQKVMNVVISIVIVTVISYLFWQSIGFIEMFIKSGRSTSMLKIPYALIYGIAIPSYLDMLVSYFYGLVNGVKSEAKEAAGNE